MFSRLPVVASLADRKYCLSPVVVCVLNDWRIMGSTMGRKRRICPQSSWTPVLQKSTPLYAACITSLPPACQDGEKSLNQREERQCWLLTEDTEGSDCRITNVPSLVLCNNACGGRWMLSTPFCSGNLYGTPINSPGSYRCFRNHHCNITLSQPSHGTEKDC